MNRKIRYFTGKIGYLSVIVLAVTGCTFLMVDLLPGDVAFDLVGETGSMEDVSAKQKELGLNRNIAVRYIEWLANVFRGDLGISYRTEEPVAAAIASRLPVTIELILLSQCIALALAIPSGILCARRPGSVWDRILSSAAFATISIPGFIMALLLIYCFALKLEWFPATGFVPVSDGLWPNLKSMLLPGLSIAMVEWVGYMRVLRSDMITTLTRDYILMARAKGLGSARILFCHALKPSLFTLITIMGLHVGHLISGALIVETIFALPGIGRLLVGAIYGHDFILVQGCVLFIAVGYVVINFAVDIGYAVLDPRIVMEQGR
jgi:peptide/nickel transport system permease protein